MGKGIDWDADRNPGKLEIACDFELLDELGKKLVASTDPVFDAAQPPAISEKSDGIVAHVDTAAQAASLGFQVAAKALSDLAQLVADAATQVRAYGCGMREASSILAEGEDTATCKVNHTNSLINDAASQPLWTQRSYPDPAQVKPKPSWAQSFIVAGLSGASSEGGE
ncbi:MAG: hypothetical protein LBM66_04060 [Bifidobacteriaceae bacterium]|jgi:hypothetical protein|nr:hypothetical protein [Bifidobacteriaceae bacterium]